MSLRFLFGLALQFPSGKVFFLALAQLVVGCVEHDWLNDWLCIYGGMIGCLIRLCWRLLNFCLESNGRRCPIG